MKKIKIAFGTLVIAIGVGGAFLTTHATDHRVNAQDDITYYWFNNESGTGTPVAATVDQRESDTGCGSGTTFCQDGYRADQFVGGNPSNGLQSGQVASPAQQLLQP